MEPATYFGGRRQPALLADALVNFMRAGKAGVEKRYEAASRLSEAWVRILPHELAEHCRIIDLSGSCLTVEANSPSYLYELRISSHWLVENLRRDCPAVKVRTIKVVLSR